MASTQSARITELYERWATDLARPEQVEDRETDDSWGDLTTEPRGVDYVETEAGGGPAMWAAPKGVPANRVILALHGGGFVGGSMYTHRKLFGHVAKQAGARALVLGLPHTPRHRYPAQLDVAFAAYRELLDRGARVALLGDSSGGGLAVATMLRARDGGLPVAVGMALISPWVDLEATGDAYDAGHDPYFTRELVHSLAAMYTSDLGDPLANPARADLTGLPPAYVQVGAWEALLDDSRLLAAKLDDAELDEFPEMLHTFQIGAGRVPEATDAVARLASWLRPRLEVAR
jgi:epsilon-lactone hydrolase